MLQIGDSADGVSFLDSERIGKDGIVSELEDLSCLLTVMMDNIF